VLIPLPPAVGRAIDRAIEDRANGPILAPELHPRRVHGLRHLTKARRRTRNCRRAFVADVVSKPFVHQMLAAPLGSSDVGDDVPLVEVPNL